jgi:four helix bundle protein
MSDASYQISEASIKKPIRTSGERSTVPIRHFTDLIAWQKARQVSGEVFRLSKRWPAEERYSLIDQIRRASRSVGANIAEAWGKRRYEAAFVAKLVDADGEAHETEHWLIEAGDCGYLSADEVARLREAVAEVGRLIGGILANPTPFLSKPRVVPPSSL